MDGLALERVDSRATFDDDFANEDVDDDQDDSALQAPHNVQRLQHDQSILCLAVNEQHIYAGTQGGEVLVRAEYALDSPTRLTKELGLLVAHV